jgi:hypothetical protein
MIDAARLAPSSSLWRGKLRHWRATLRRTFMQPDSVTLLSLAPEDVARRLIDERATST